MLAVNSVSIQMYIFHRLIRILAIAMETQYLQMKPLLGDRSSSPLLSSPAAFPFPSDSSSPLAPASQTLPVLHFSPPPSLRPLTSRERSSLGEFLLLILLAPSSPGFVSSGPVSGFFGGNKMTPNLARRCALRTVPAPFSAVARRAAVVRLSRSDLGSCFHGVAARC